MSSLKPISHNFNYNTNKLSVTRKNSQSFKSKISTFQKIIVFDTETTGFLLTRIIQLAYCKYYFTGSLHSQTSYYVRQLEDNKLQPLIAKEYPDKDIQRMLTGIRHGEKEAQSVHHIPDEIIYDKTLPTINEVLAHFEHSLEDVDLMIGHNLLYDLRVIYNEASRIGAESLMRKLMRIKYIDTMEISKKLVNAYTIKGLSKNPNLTELYKKLFPYAPDVLGMHNAIIDVDVTARCYFELKELVRAKYPNVHIRPKLFVPKKIELEDA